MCVKWASWDWILLWWTLYASLSVCCRELTLTCVQQPWLSVHCFLSVYHLYGNSVASHIHPFGLMIYYILRSHRGRSEGHRSRSEGQLRPIGTKKWGSACTEVRSEGLLCRSHRSRSEGQLHPMWGSACRPGLDKQGSTVLRSCMGRISESLLYLEAG